MDGIAFDVCYAAMVSGFILAIGYPPYDRRSAIAQKCKSKVELVPAIKFVPAMLQSRLSSLVIRSAVISSSMIHLRREHKRSLLVYFP